MASSPPAPRTPRRFAPPAARRRPENSARTAAAPLAGATCASCAAPLTPGAKFCHRCGTPAGADAPTDASKRSRPRCPGRRRQSRWSRSSRSSPVSASARSTSGRGRQHRRRAAEAPFAGATATGQAAGHQQALAGRSGRAPLQPRDGRSTSAVAPTRVQLFAPMAIAAYQMTRHARPRPALRPGTHRRDLGRRSARPRRRPTRFWRSTRITCSVSFSPRNAAHLRKDAAGERAYRDKLVAAAPTERAKQLPEYITHENDITIALDAKRP